MKRVLMWSGGKDSTAMVRRFDPIDESVWCDIHGCVHDKTHDPYDYGTTPDEAECGPSDWRKLWAGAYVKPTKTITTKPAEEAGKE